MSNADNGMMTKVWGPAGWMFLHSVAFGYPQEIDGKDPEHVMKRQSYKLFFESIGHVLPCKYCRESYQQYARDMPIDNFLDTRRGLCRWLYAIHNMVNEKLDVPKGEIPTFEAVEKFYEKLRAKCTRTVKAKGCTDPVDGRPKRCRIDVITGDESLWNVVFEWRHWVVPTLVISLAFALYMRYSRRRK